MRFPLPKLLPNLLPGLLLVAGLAWAVDRREGLPSAAAAEGWAVAEARDSQAARAVEALARAYPGRVQEAAYRDGDWAVRVGDTWFYWAEGRMLPAGLRAQWERYAPYRFYRYPAGLPPVAEPDPRVRERLRAIVERNEAFPPERHEGLLSALFQAGTRGQTEARLAAVDFLGLKVSVHRLAAPALSAVAAELERLRKTDPQVRAFLSGLKGLAGYNWRPIDGTRSRSYHSYGLAVDLLPKSYGGRHVYWRWSMEQDPDWYAIPYARRWMVPEAVVRAFEARGFVWGGKWLFFDTMHFEYRPELLLFSGLQVLP
jgi:hypothetical protein